MNLVIRLSLIQDRRRASWFSLLFNTYLGQWPQISPWCPFRPASSSSSKVMMKEIDGGTLEGGGQLLRNTCSFAALLHQSVTITKIRKNRKPPGLKAQHTAGIKLVGNISSGSILNGAHKDSMTVEFIPGIIEGGVHTADPGTAGSTTLLLQISLPLLLFAPPRTDGSTLQPQLSKLSLRGGTNAIQAPQIEYTQHVFLPFLSSRFNLASNLSLEIRKHGYYPKGGGEISIEIHSITKPIQAIELLDRGDLVRVEGKAFAAGLPKAVAVGMRDAASSFLQRKGIDPSIVNIEVVRESPANAFGAGSGIVLWATTTNGCILGGSSIGRKGIDTRDVGTEAAGELWRGLEKGGCVDEYLQDQMIIFLALAEGTSRVRVGWPLELHTQTAIWVAEQFTDAKFRITEEGSTATIECDGIGFVPGSTLASQQGE